MQMTLQPAQLSPGSVSPPAAIPHSPSPESIREQLKKITASGTFVRSKDLCRFLSFAAEQALCNQEGALKEYVIGVTVFRRGDSFNPSIDPIVRVQARRLRRKLNQYYETEGRNDRVMVELPVGGYVPVFRDGADSAGSYPLPERPAIAEKTAPSSAPLSAHGAAWSSRNLDRRELNTFSPHGPSAGHEDAQKLCQIALACSRQATPEGLQRSIQCYERALEIDPDCPPAHAALAVIQAMKALLDGHLYTV